MDCVRSGQHFIGTDCEECTRASRKPATDAELMALAALSIVDAEDCRAANTQREALGQSMAYGEVQSEAADVLRAELKRRGILKGGQ